MKLHLNTFIFALFSLPFLFLAHSSAVAQRPRLQQRVIVLENKFQKLEAELAELRRIVHNDKLWPAIQGIWTQVSYSKSGKPVEESDEAHWYLKPTRASKMILSPEPPVWILGRMTIDASQSPVWVDFQYNRFGDRERVIPGILKVVDDQLHIALREDSDCAPREDRKYPERPTSFESTSKNGVSVFLLERLRTTDQVQ